MVELARGSSIVVNATVCGGGIELHGDNAMQIHQQRLRPRSIRELPSLSETHMGLDITAYRQLTPAPDAAFDKDGNLIEWQKFWQPGGSMDWSEKNWPGRAEGIADSKTVYSFAEEFDFRAGSYSAYNEWRDWLARVGGWKTAEDAWRAESGPFFELVNFADNEGVIGPKVAAKLAKDFAAHDGRARSMDPDGGDGYYYQLYRKWCRALDMAAENGAIDFH